MKVKVIRTVYKGSMGTKVWVIGTGDGRYSQGFSASRYTKAEALKIAQKECDHLALEGMFSLRGVDIE